MGSGVEARLQATTSSAQVPRDRGRASPEKGAWEPTQRLASFTPPLQMGGRSVMPTTARTTPAAEIAAGSMCANSACRRSIIVMGAHSRNRRRPGPPRVQATNPLTSGGQQSHLGGLARG